MITHINFGVRGTPGEYSIFHVDIRDNYDTNFTIELAGDSKYMFFPVLLMSGIIAEDWKKVETSELAVRIKNKIEEKMTASDLTWVILDDTDENISMMMSENM